MVSDGLSEFLFEIASDERLGILEGLAKRPMKHSEIARLLSMTGSETTRHLNRLTGAGLVAKNIRGEYELTPLAETLRTGLPFFEFLTTNRAYLMSHRASVLEPAFVERLGELRHGSFVTGTYQVVAVQEATLRNVQRRVWVVTEQRFEQALPILREKASRGADVRVVRSRRFLETEKRLGQDVVRNFPVKMLSDVKLFLAVLDDQAGVCLPRSDGAVDMADMILLTDPEGCRWAEDLFLRYWEKAAPWRVPPAAEPAGR
jgi:predicted transcriptional regulator